LYAKQLVGYLTHRDTSIALSCVQSGAAIPAAQRSATTETIETVPTPCPTDFCGAFHSSQVGRVARY
jgi:hypothetical protein